MVKAGWKRGRHGSGHPTVPITAIFTTVYYSILIVSLCVMYAVCTGGVPWMLDVSKRMQVYGCVSVGERARAVRVWECVGAEWMP
jgi:hypothetical protein